MVTLNIGYVNLGTESNVYTLRIFHEDSHRFVNLLDGDTDWAAVMEAFRAVGYDGYVVHEVGGR